MHSKSLILPHFSLSCLLFLAVCFPSSGHGGEPPLSTQPSALSTATIDSERLGRIDGVVGQAIERGELPGAVVLILHRGRVVFRKAYGLRSKQPVETAMTPDAVFDLASLTKPVATATAIWILIEQGKLRLSDRVAQHLPAFGQNGKDKITVEHLLLHTSGLMADNPEADYRDGKAKALERICQLTPVAGAGARFLYSDVGYIVLGELVERKAGMALDEFVHEHIFAPLKMNDTGFPPLFSRGPEGSRLRERVAPTVRRDGRWLAGEVHDPPAFQMGGVAGHAGLFSTADDLAVYAQMLLGNGEYQGRRILSPLAVQAMTEPHSVPGGLRTCGWDAQTTFSSNRGELFPSGGGFGHTGFTGTSMWIDPGSDTAVIFLSSRLHPDGKGNVMRLRGEVATLAAAALVRPLGHGLQTAPQRPKTGDTTPVSAHRSPGTLTGIDVLVREGFKRLKGRRVGLVTNHTGLDREGRATIDLLHKAEGVTLVALFSPEHGIRGRVEEPVADSKDEKTGLPIYSLYGQRLKPTAETLKGIDTLVYDIQDAGCRFYTYISTLGYLLEVSGQRTRQGAPLRVLVLDRPNPIGGLAVEGPILDAGRESFVAFHPLPVRHGLTVGELARLFNAERKLGADLEVVHMEGWQRGDLYDRTGLLWVNPSPNLRGLAETLLYPGVGLLERTNVSVGRGTDRPFEWIGAPWLDGPRLAAAMSEQDLPGVRFVPLNLTPAASVHQGKVCGGVHILVDDWSRFRPVPTGIALACALHRLYPGTWQVERFDDLLRHRATWEGLKRGDSWQKLEKAWQADLQRFLEVRRKYLIYTEE